MRVLAVVPARGGSAGVPLKNLAPVGGVPLVARAVRACLRAELVDEVVVSTDHAGSPRPPAPRGRASWTAPGGAARRHRLQRVRGAARPRRARAQAAAEVVVLVQCTSPFIDPADLTAPSRRCWPARPTRSSPALPTHEFSGDATAARSRGVNHDAGARPRRQDREPQLPRDRRVLRMRTAGLREHGHRFFGRVAVQPVPARPRVGDRRPRGPGAGPRARAVRGPAARADRRRRRRHRLRRRAHRRPRLRRLRRPRDRAGQPLRRHGRRRAAPRRGPRADPVHRAQPGRGRPGRASSASRCCRASRTSGPSLLDWLPIEGLDPAARRLRRQRRQRPGPAWPRSAGRSRCPTPHPRVRAAARVVLSRPRRRRRRARAVRPGPGGREPARRHADARRHEHRPTVGAGARSATCWSAPASPST